MNFALLEHSPASVMATDTRGRIEYVNAAFEALTGYLRAEAAGRSAAILKSGRQEPEFYRSLWRTVLAGRPFRGVFINRKKSGELYHVENLIWPVYEDGRIAHFVCAGRDVTERVQEMAKLAHAATHDPLTDLPNRALYLDRFDQALRQSARSHEGFALALMDLDRFRDTNNRFGHPAGDAVLQAVAARTSACLRATDTVARIGGDEFALVLPGAGERVTAAALLDKVVSANCAPLGFEGRELAVSVSVGACLYPAHGEDAEEMRKRADEALYAAKHAGGSCYRICAEREAPRSTRRLARAP